MYMETLGNMSFETTQVTESMRTTLSVARKAYQSLTQPSQPRIDLAPHKIKHKQSRLLILAPFPLTYNLASQAFTDLSMVHRPPSVEPAIDSAAHLGNSLAHNHPWHRVQAAMPKTAVAGVLVDFVASTAAVGELAKSAAVVEGALAVAVAVPGFGLAAVTSSVRRLASDRADSAMQ
jgi:hypothetical protein